MRHKSGAFPLTVGRRNFLKSASAGLIGIAGINRLSLPEQSNEENFVKRTKNERLQQIASNSYAVIESFREMADYVEKLGVKVTIENHWGLAADPINILIILNEVNSPYCEASPDFCNWEHEYMLYNGLEVLIPKAKSMCHAKRWTRYPGVDINRCVQVLNNAKYKGYISLEYEAGGDPVEGTLKLMEDVVEALI